MGWQLCMSVEISDWLHEASQATPGLARLVGIALTALASEGPAVGPPLVVGAGSRRPAADPRPGLDRLYEDRLEQVTRWRRGAAEARTLAHDMAARIDALESRRERIAGQPAETAGDGDQHPAQQVPEERAAVPEQLDDLRRRLPGVVTAERDLTARSQREQARLEKFRSRKETLKARYAAALAELSVREAIADIGEGAADVAAILGDPSVALRALREVTTEIERETGAASGAEPGGSVAPGLMELRPGAPGRPVAGILFATEPAGSLLLLAVLEDVDALREHYREAVTAASDLLKQVRAGKAAEAAERIFPDAGGFLDEFFPGEGTQVAAAAADLAGRIRGCTLAQQRARLGLTRTEVATRMHVPPEKVAAMERAEPGATGVRPLADYIEALGGRLEIAADFGGERTVLR